MENLTIRDEQIRRFELELRSGFERKVEDYLREAFPQATAPLDNAALRQRIRIDTDRALAYDIETERDVCHFIDLTFRYNREFDRGPVAEILKKKDAGAPERLREAGMLLRRQGQRESP